MTLKRIPHFVQLPGGYKLHAALFVVTAYNEDGSPRMFELQPADSKQVAGRDEWFLFVNEAQIRQAGWKDRKR